MGVYSRAAANWEAGGYGAFMSVPAVQPGLLAAIVPDHTLGYLKDNMMLLQDVALVSRVTWPVIYTRGPHTLGKACSCGM